MTWELYEVWAEDDLGHEDLVDTTPSLKEARKIADTAIDEGAVRAKILKESPDGDFEVVEEIERQ